jgi:aerobic C4-dicarboxylate transport protein
MTALAIDKPRGRAWWKELWIQVLIAMAAGIALGIVNPEGGARMQPLGDAFIKAIRMLIAPIIFCTVVHGIAHMADMARVGRVAVKAIVYFEIMTTIALIIGLVSVNLLKPGVGMNIDPASINASAIEPYVKQTAVIGFVPFLINIVPATGYRQHSRDKCRAGARHPSPDVAGADADQSDRERGRDHRDCQMGRRARWRTPEARAQR